MSYASWDWMAVFPQCRSVFLDICGCIRDVSAGVQEEEEWSGHRGKLRLSGLRCLGKPFDLSVAVTPFYLSHLERDPPWPGRLLFTLWAHHELDSGRRNRFTFTQISWTPGLLKKKKATKKKPNQKKPNKTKKTTQNLASWVCPKSEWIETPKEAPAAKGNPGQVLLSFFTGLFRTTLGVSSFLFWYFTLIHNKKHIVLMNYISENIAGDYKGPGQRTLFLTLLPCELISQMKALQLFGVIFLSFSWMGHKGKSCLCCVNKKCLSRNEEQRR